MYIFWPLFILTNRDKCYHQPYGCPKILYETTGQQR